MAGFYTSFLMKAWSIVCAVALSVSPLACSVIEGDNADPGALDAPSTTLQLGEGIVVVKNTSYNPAAVAVPVGREVVWTFDDRGVNHTVTADDKSFDSGRLTSGDFRRSFDKAGEYLYHCEVHARMKGTVVVS